MRYDDRLKTVLDASVEGARDRAVRWRQIAELLARGAAAGDEDLLAEALEAVRSELPAIDEKVRMATARAIAPQQLPVALVALFASDRLSVAAPVLAGARLTAVEWGDVLADASSECRSFIRSLRSEESGDPASAPSASTATESNPIPSIGEVVARIERVRQHRSEPPASEAADDMASPLFRWESDESGEIAWVEGAPRGPLIGRSIAKSRPGEGVDRRVEQAFAERMAFSDAVLDLAEGTPVAGRWKISGSPAFDRATGRFAGYRGIAERESSPASPALPPADPDSLRELAHEIKTPLNAIVGFAEIISGQYLGPADHRYRERAAEIVAQADLLLAAVDDLDFAAKLQSAGGGAPQPTELARLLESLSGPLSEVARSRGATLDRSPVEPGDAVAVDARLAERLVLRVATAVLQRAEAGESLRLGTFSRGEARGIEIGLPRAIAGGGEDRIFGPPGGLEPQTAMLRLARGLARISNSQLTLSNSAIAISFPVAAWRHD